MNFFKLTKKSKKSQARAGVLTTAHGKIATPFFMPIATQGTVKTLSMMEMKRLGAAIILGNSYHLYLKPGLSVIKKAGSPRSPSGKAGGEAGGLHQFINWSGPILTDSGGFQVFSLENSKVLSTSLKAGKIQNSKFQVKSQNFNDNNLVQVTNKGVEFKSVYDGSRHLFTPPSVIKMQQAFGSDIMMVLDQCVPNPCSYEKAKEAMERTVRWAKSCITHHVSRIKKNKNETEQLLFGIIQGSLYRDLRIKCARELVKMDFDGYAIGGLAVGESPSEMYKVLDYTVPELPKDKPRYLMGVGYPEQIIEAVKRGIDMFDCVIPTREARHGRLYLTSNKFQIPNSKQISNPKLQFSKPDFYQTINVKTERFSRDFSPINSNSKLAELREYSKAYLRHLFNVNEPLALRLATLNNLEFYLELMKKIRLTIKTGGL